jgi:hypothetical protein
MASLAGLAHESRHSATHVSGPSFAVAKWRPVQRRVARHHGLDAIDVVRVDRLLELPDLLQGA